MSPCCCARSDGGEADSCGDCRTWEEDLYWNRFQSFYFCQILSSISEFQNQLVIPKKFANNARLPSKVTLRGPSRASWSAALMKRDDDLFLTDGWGEFVRAYSLKASDILIVKFDGVSAFDVQIFDGGNLCEKESAYFVKKCTHENPAENTRKRASTETDIEGHDDAFIHRATKQAREEVVNDTLDRSKYSHFYSRSKRKKLSRKSVSSKASPGKRASLNSLENMNIPSGEHGQLSVQTEPMAEPQSTEKNGSDATEAPNQNNAPQNDRSCSIETPSPPQVTPNINGSNLTEATPQHKSETNGRSSSEAIPLRVPSSRGRGRPKRLIDSEPNPRIQRKASSSKVASSLGRPRKQLSAKKAARGFTLGNIDASKRTYVPEEGRQALQMALAQLTDDNFIVVMRATTVCRRYILTLPPAWCRKHLSPSSQDVFFRFGDKTFLTRLSYTPQKTAGQICGGWKSVVDANQLKLYDVCLFNVASQKDNGIILDVTVFRAGQQGDECKGPASDDVGIDSGLDLKSA